MRLESSNSEKVGTFLIIELESFILGNIRNFFEVDFFIFFELGLYLKVVSYVALHYTTGTHFIGLEMMEG